MKENRKYYKENNIRKIFDTTTVNFYRGFFTVFSTFYFPNFSVFFSRAMSYPEARKVWKEGNHLYRIKTVPSDDIGIGIYG